MKPLNQNEFKEHVIAMATNGKNDAFFSICTIADACKIVGIHDYHLNPTYQLLSSIHCLDFSAMSPELKARIPLMIREVLTPKKSIARRAFEWLAKKLSKSCRAT